jgi:phosphomannomutase
MEKTRIMKSLKNAVSSSGLKVENPWGETTEDRGSQITFSALGQRAPLKEKVKWDRNFIKRKLIKAALEISIPNFRFEWAAPSIDITKAGIDKAYGIRKLRDVLGISLEEMIFVGDALFGGGNDYPVAEAGVDSIPVRGPAETKLVIEAIVACLSSASRNAKKVAPTA